MIKAVLYLTHTTLVVQTEKKSLITLELADFLEDNAIKDEAAFTLYLKDKLEPIGKKIEQGIVVLGLGLLHQKAVEKGEDEAAARKELLTEITIPEKNIQEKVITTPSKSYLLVTDKSYYEIVVKVCRDIGIDVLAVLPLSLFSDGAEDTLNKDEVTTILGKEQLYEAGNFLEAQGDTPSETKDEGAEPSKKIELEEADAEEESDPLPPYETVSTWNKSRLILILGFLVVLTLLLGGLIYLQYTHQSILPSLKPTPTPTEAPTPTPVPKEAPKASLKVEVQNGTGTPGQAAKAKGLMEGLEYTNVTTSNAENTTHETTEVVFSSNVSEVQQKEIKDLLLKSFSVVTTTVDPSAKTDILITTGTEK